MEWIKSEKISKDVESALTPDQLKKNVFSTDEKNLKRDIELEQEAIDIYSEHIKKTDKEHIKKLLNHIMKEEQRHKIELQTQLRDLSKPIPKDVIDEIEPEEEKKGEFTNSVIVRSKIEKREYWICPHCNNEIKEKSLSFDGENWHHGCDCHEKSIVLP